MTKREQIAARVDALVAEGGTKADAYVQVATEFGLKPNSVRGAYYQATKANGSSTPRARVRETTTENALASATAVLEKALVDIDLEIDAARRRVEEATAEHKALKTSAEERKQAIKAKIDTLKQ